MKNLKLFFIILLFSSHIIAENIDEYKTDIYFANGVGAVSYKNSYIQGEERILEYIIENSSIEKYIGEYDLAFNTGHGVVLDFYEAWLQYIDENPSAKFGWEAFTVAMGRATVIGGGAIELSKAVVLKHEADDISKQVTAYEESIKSGHGVLVLAHSQGNFFTNKAYDSDKGITPWMRDYFKTIGLATPSEIKIPHSAYFTYDNDPISTLNGVGEIKENPMRYYKWLAGPDVITDSTSTVPCTPVTIPKEDTPMCSEEGWYAEDSNFNDFHAFEYYMQTRITQKKIYESLNYAIGLHNSVHTFSQWKVTDLCNSFAHVTHKYSPEKLKLDDYIYVVSKEGKLFHDGVGYVKADYDDVIDRDNILDDPSFIPQSGVIEVGLTWEDAALNMDLDVDMSFGQKDIQDVCKPLEHFYVASENDVQAGTYSVYINQLGGLDNIKLPQNIYLSIATPSAQSAMTFDFNITSADMLNIGHVADIIIKEDKKVEFAHITSASINLPNITYYGTPTSNSNSSITVVEYAKYIYDVESKLKQALLGPISNAQITLSKALDIQNTLPFYYGYTSAGNSLLTSGLLNFPSSILNTIKSEDFYILSVNGGEDIDADDDKVLDATPTQNNGSIRTVLSGDKIKNESFKVNILTEVVYQLTKEMLISDSNTTALNNMLDEIAKKLIIEDVNDDGEINYDDILVWMPSFDKDKLLKPYDIYYQPIVEKIYNDEDIYDEAYALVNDPIFRKQELHVLEDAAQQSVVGELKVDLYDGEVSYTLSGEYSNYFEISQDGKVLLSYEADLDYETTQKYTLHIDADIGSEVLSSELIVYIDDVLDAPVIKGFGTYIPENTISGTYVGKMDVNQGLDNITEIVLQGYGSESFEVNLEGEIFVSSGAVLDYEEYSNYDFSVIAYNSFGYSLPALIYIHLSDLPEPPILHPFSVTVKEPAAGTAIGILSVNENKSPIISIDLRGDGDENFNIDLNGVITVSKNASFENNTEFNLYALAVNDYGVSNSVNINIKVILGLQSIGSYITPGSPYGAVLSKDGKIAFIADGHQGLSIINISNPFVPKLLGSYATGIFAYSVKISSDENTAYIASLNNGLQIIDITDPSTPTLIGIYDTAGSAYDVELSKDSKIAFVADYHRGLQIIDISDLTKPSLIGSYDGYGYARKVKLSSNEDTAYIANLYGIQILDISNLTDPSLVVNYNTYDSTFDIELSDDENTAYVANGSKGLYILDISNPFLPIYVGSYKTTKYASGPYYSSNGVALDIKLSLDGTIAYVGNQNNGLQIVNISNPEEPYLIDGYDIYGNLRYIELSENGITAYLFNAQGLQIVNLGF